MQSGPWIDEGDLDLFLAADVMDLSKLDMADHSWRLEIMMD